MRMVGSPVCAGAVPTVTTLCLGALARLQRSKGRDCELCRGAHQGSAAASGCAFVDGCEQNQRARDDHGLVASGARFSRPDIPNRILAAWRAGAPDPIRWIVISIHGVPDWAREGEVRTTGVPFRTTDAEAQIAAVRQGLGMTTLPCCVRDPDPLLARLPGTDLHMYGTLWLLTQGETRKTKRVRLFTEFVSRRLAAYAPLLAGLSISGD